MENGKELIIYGVHMSAYGNSDEIREAQTSMLFQDMKSEMDKGNYVICGGDFNHDLKLAEDDSVEYEAGHIHFQEAKCRKVFHLPWISYQRKSTTVWQILTEMMILNIFREKLLPVY